MTLKWGIPGNLNNPLHISAFVACDTRIYIQLYWLEMAPLLNKSYENEVTLRGYNIPLKYYQPLEILTL